MRYRGGDKGVKVKTFYAIIEKNDRSLLYECDATIRSEAIEYFDRVAKRIDGYFDGNVYTYKNQ